MLSGPGVMVTTISRRDCLKLVLAANAAWLGSVFVGPLIGISLPAPLANQAHPEAFTRLELDVLALVGRGRTTSEIALQLGTAKRVVRAQLRSLYRKFRTHRSADEWERMGLRPDFLARHF